jgi:hypothetical protein
MASTVASVMYGIQQWSRGQNVNDNQPGIPLNAATSARPHDTDIAGIGV